MGVITFRIGTCCQCGPDELGESGDEKAPGLHDALPFLDVTIPTLDGMWVCAFTEVETFTGVDLSTPGDGRDSTGFPVME